MCGICGAVDWDGLGEGFASRLEAMVDSLRHRGPDASGRRIERHVALGHARLSIIDLADGSQPMGNEDGTIWVAYNGEIYNFASLRQNLLAKGHAFRTRSDTEVILHLYEEEGIECLRHFRGMFAIALWDSRQGALYLVRDRLGIKPLYYAQVGGRLLFGSEIKAILRHGGVHRALRPDALSDFLTFLYVPAPKTMFKDIYKLPAGHWLRFDRHGVTLRQYWDLHPAAVHLEDRPAIEAELVERLAEAVRLRLVSDVPLGAFLSGGVDSSAVVAMMARANQRPLATVSVGFPEAKYNELRHARRVAERYATDHYERMVQPQAARVIDLLAWHYDEPFADYSSIPTYYVSQAARQVVTVALSGDGGDENFGGYRRYRFDLLERRLRRAIPDPLRRWVIGPLGKAYPKADWLPRPLRAKTTLINLADDAPGAYCRSVGFLDDDQKRSFLHGDVAALLGDYRSADIIRDHMARARRADLDEITYADIKTYLVDDILTKVDRASMAVSLEVRVPLLDHTFVEFAAGIPGDMKIDHEGQKSVFKSALRPYLDLQTLYRPKQGFTPPIVEWLRGPLREMAGDLLMGPHPAYAEYLDAGAIAGAWRRHQAGTRNFGPLLYAVLTFELWCRRFLHAGDSFPSPEAAASTNVDSTPTSAEDAS